MLSGEQQKIVSYFENALKTDSLRHAYIIHGEKGLGTKTVADSVGLLFACKTHSGCGQCNGCKSACLGANPDVIRLSNGDKKNYEVSKIRELIKKLYEKPSGGKYKLVVIENAHLLGEICQNALLKAIEEPPSYAVFILLCDNISEILPTIMSRVMLLELMNWKKHELKEVLPLEESEAFLYDYCMGNVGTLMEAASDPEFKKLRDETINSFQKLISSGRFGVYEAVEAWVSNKELIGKMLGILTLFLRDVMFFKNGQKKDIINTDKTQQIQEVSSKVTFSQALEMTETVVRAPSVMRRNENMNMAIQTMFMNIEETIRRKK